MSQEAQAVAWFCRKEIKDKDSVVNKGQSTELCLLPALLQLQRATLGRSVPLQLHFPGQPCSCLLAVRVLVSWLGRGWLLMESKKMCMCSRGEILHLFSFSRSPLPFKKHTLLFS